MMKRHLRACGVLACTLLVVSGWAVELHAQSPNVPPDGIVFRSPFLDENGNVTNENVARPDSIEFRVPFLGDTGMVTNPAVPAPRNLEFRTPFLGPEGEITQTHVAPTEGLEFRPVFLDPDGNVVVEDLEPPAGLEFRDPFVGADGDVGVSAVPVSLPDARLLQLDSVSPNPFNPGTQISFRLRSAAEVTVSVLDLRGTVVRTLHQGELTADLHVMRWDGRDAAGRPAASGLYVFRIRAGAETVVTKGVLVK